MRFKLTIAYDGSDYCGWQVQPNGTSIQTTVQSALETVLRHPVALSGAGRTDAGVHARGQTAHFDTEGSVEPTRMRLALNALLPPDIRILSVEQVSEDFHARYRATGKIYHYHLQLDPTGDPRRRRYRTRVFGSFDGSALKIAAHQFVGTHDFHAFANRSGKSHTDTIRTLTRLDVFEEEGGLRLEFEGDGFLYKMVRNITGTLLQVASGVRTPESALLYKGETAPPQGLVLIAVTY